MKNKEKELSAELTIFEKLLNRKRNQLDRLEVKQQKIDAKFHQNNERYGAYIHGCYRSGRLMWHWSEFQNTINSIVLTKYTLEYEDRKLDIERKKLNAEIKELQYKVSQWKQKIKYN